MNYYNGMSAQEAREAGLHVPDDVPDVATLELTPDVTSVAVAQVAEPGMVKVSFVATGAWRWIAVDFVLDVENT